MPYDPNTIAEMIVRFEDNVSQKGRPTGQATGGRSFESNLTEALGKLIGQIAQELKTSPCLIQAINESGKTLNYIGLRNGNRYIIWNLPNLAKLFKANDCLMVDNLVVRHSWLANMYSVCQWYDTALGALRSRGWIPVSEDETYYQGERYSEIYKGSKITFDGTIALIESNEL